jgi:4'-phosphopantetheinyl transferase
MESGTVHVWHVDLEDEWDRFSPALNAEERARAERYAASGPARQFKRCRAALRVLLARHCHCAPADLSFRYGRWGKPELEMSDALVPLHFNVSHSGERALVAISGAPIGIDLQSSEHVIDIDGLIDLVGHSEEKRALAALPRDEAMSAFYRLWTRKEAYCKAVGSGLQLSLPSISFRLTETGTVQVNDEASSTSLTWWVHDLQMPEEQVASLCATQPELRVLHRTARADQLLPQGGR